ncbi:MAG TPA: ABC transporter ATP-binding protein, partial [Rhodothermales bacterium]|nr:ABC transporter ATP-binding protein [Rhodothermales bacterium]
VARFSSSSPLPDQARDGALRIDGVSFSYGDRLALDDVSFSVEQGELFGLLGPNGGGKTTLFRILSTLIQPRSGSVSVFGHDVASEPDRVRQALGVVFQHSALDADLTVLENLRFHSALYGVPPRTFRERSEALLAFFDVADRAASRVSTLSGGLQRRVDLVRALLHAPRLLLLDEPTTGLDPAARRTFWQALSRQRKTEGTTMLAATHLMEEAEGCDRVGIIDRGRLVAVGTPSELKEEVGQETLWLETDDPVALRDRIQAQFGVDAVVFEKSLQIAHPEAHTLLASLYEAFGREILSATVRRPTLEDVFLMRTGYRIGEGAVESV